MAEADVSELPFPFPIYLCLCLDEVVTKISAGAYHSVALTSSGRVFTWGNNNKAQNQSCFDSITIPLLCCNHRGEWQIQIQ